MFLFLKEEEEKRKVDMEARGNRRGERIQILGIPFPKKWKVGPTYKRNSQKSKNNNGTSVGD